MDVLIRPLEAVTRMAGKLAAWLIVPLAASMVWEVVSRYFFANPTIWAYEVAYMQMGALFFLGIAYVSQIDGHVRVDLAYQSFSPRWKSVMDLAGSVFIFPLIIWLCFGLWDYFENAWRSGETSGESIWSPVVWPARAIFWVGFVLLAAQISANMLKAIRTIVTGRAYGGDNKGAGV